MAFENSLSQKVVEDQVGAQILETVDGVLKCRVQYIICLLGIPDIMMEKKNPMSASEMSEAVKEDVDTSMLQRILRFASALGIIKEGVTEDNIIVFSPTLVTERLCVNHPSSLAHQVLHRGGTIDDVAVKLERLVIGKYRKKQNVTLFEEIQGKSFWQYMCGNASARKNFDNHLDFLSETFECLVPYIAEAISVEGDGEGCTFMDVGGSTSEALRYLVERFPEMKFVNFDLPEVVSKAPVLDRVELVGGNFFDYSSWPKADAVLLKLILHDWNDDQCIIILSNCFKCLPVGGSVLIVEQLLPDVGEVSEATKRSFQYDLVMSIYFDGRERLSKEYERLLRMAGFQYTHCIPVPESYSGSSTLCLVVGTKREC